MNRSIWNCTREPKISGSFIIILILHNSKVVKAEYYHIEGWKNFEILYGNGKIIEFHKEGYKVKRRAIVKSLKPFLLLVLIIMVMYQSTIDEVI